MDSNLAVKISADVTDMQTKLALAQASLRAFSAETKTLADQVRVAGTVQQSELLPGLQASAVGAAKARAEVYGLKEALGGANDNVRGLREIKSAIMELSTGEISKLPGTFALLSHHVFELGYAGIGAVAGVAGLAAGLVAFAVHAYRASEAAEAARASFAFHGLSESAIQINTWVSDVAKLPGVSTEAAEKTVAAFAQIRDATPQLIQALTSRLPALAKGMGTDVPTAAQKLADVFSDVDKKGEQFLRGMGASSKTINDFVTAASSGNRAGEFSILIAQMDVTAQGIDKTLKEATATEKTFFEQMMFGLAGSVVGYENLQKIIEELDDAKLKKINDDLKAAQTNPTTTPKLSMPLGDFDAQLEKLKESTQRSNLAILDDEIALYRQRLQAADIYGQERTALERRLATTLADRNREAGSEVVANARVQIAATNAQDNLSSLQKLVVARNTWQAILDGDKLTYAQRVDAQRSYNEASAAVNRAGLAESIAIQRADNDTDIEIGRLKIEATKNMLAQQFAAKQISAQQQFDQLRSLAKQEETLDEQRLQSQLSRLQTEPLKYAETYNQIRVLREKLNVDLANYDKQQELDQLKSDKDQVTAWKGAVNEMASAEDSFVRGVFSGRQTLSQLLLGTAQHMVENEIAADLKYLTYKLLLNNTELANEKATSSGGLLIHALSENSKTAATVSGTAARNAAGATENAGFFARVGQTLASWFGLETSKTAATVTGAAARTGADVAETAASVATDATSAAAAKTSSVIAGMGYAGEAAAAAMASVAAIPFVGWAMAPEVGAETFSVAAGFASAKGGMWDVPVDGTLIAAHAKESVLPASIAGPMRDFFTGGGNQQGGGDTYNIHISAIDTQSGASFLQQNANVIVKTLAQQKRLGNSTAMAA